MFRDDGATSRGLGSEEASAPRCRAAIPFRRPRKSSTESCSCALAKPIWTRSGAHEQLSIGTAVVSGASHTVRLHFAETYFSTKGSRVFNVSINGTQVLTDFDIFTAAGAKNKALIEQFTESANSSGDYVIQFTSVVNNSLVSGIEIH
jgi:Malectin domain